MIKKSLLCLLAILINNVSGVEPPDLSLVYNQKSTKYFCIAEGNVLDSGIGWIFPITEKLPQIVTNYEPKTENEYNCDFSDKECTNLWQMEDWQYSSYNSHDLKPTLDSRWDNLPTILTSNNTKDFNESAKIPNTFHVGLSIRAEKNAEIFLCEGWDPHTHACYYINIGGSADSKQAFLRKYKIIPEKINRNDTKLSKYKSDKPILSEKVWKNFAVSLSDNGTLNVFDVDDKSIILNYTDSKPLKPIYLLLRSPHNRALWKIHNNRYIFTNKSNSMQMGPSFSIYGHNLCVSLYTSMCKSCKMSFYMLIDGEKKVLKEVSSKNDDSNMSWKKIKLVYRNIFENKVKIFVQTKYSNSTIRNGFWAIDDVRICSDNEIKVSQLMTNSSDKGIISCQALDFPAWRPTQHTISSTAAEEVKTRLSKPTSIRLTWKKPSKIEDKADRYYIAQYEGADTCHGTFPKGSVITKKRRKSQGYVISKNNDIIIKDLIPYTLYNVTLFNILEGNQDNLQLNTLPTEIPTKEELPRNVKMQVTATTNRIQWDSIKCNESYGLICNQLIVKHLNDSIGPITGCGRNSYNLTNLIGYTPYSLEIITARKLENFKNNTLTIKSIYNFTTSPEVAPRVKNFELYATTKNSASFRYVLPKFQGGIPTWVQIRCCHPFVADTCTSDIRKIEKCSLWKDKYCIEQKNLIKSMLYEFKLSVKNEGTEKFGLEYSLSGSAVDQAPGKPENVTYEMLQCQKLQNYCNINITWSHPYNQTGAITMFKVVLTESSFSFITDAKKSIEEILRIKQYQPTYSYMIKYLPQNVLYKISIMSLNDALRSNFTSIFTQKQDGANDHNIDETPTYINSTNETITFKLPELDWRFNASTLIIFAQDYVKTDFVINEDIRKLKIFENDNKLCNQSGNVWIAHSIKINETSSPIIVIGDNSLSYISQLNKTVINMALKPDTEYCFTFALVQQNNKENDLMIYHEQHLFTQSNHMLPDYQNTPEQTVNPAAYLIPVLLIILLASFGAWFGYRHLRKRNFCRGNDEHIYESMPFDDYIAGSFSNNTYDKLLHD